MNYRRLGVSNLRVSTLCLGTMMFGDQTDAAASADIVACAAEQGVNYIDAGQTMNGHTADTTMRVFNAGNTDLQALIMFVVDAGKPFSVPRKFEGSND